MHVCRLGGNERMYYKVEEYVNGIERSKEKEKRVRKQDNDPLLYPIFLIIGI